MRFLAITLIVHGPDPVTGVQKSTVERFREVVDNARLAEELGFDGFGVGERELFHVTTDDQWDRNTESYDRAGLNPVFTTLEDFVERGSALVGSPQQIVDKVHRYRERLGHTVPHLHADIAPVLRREIPGPPWGWGPVPAGEEAVA